MDSRRSLSFGFTVSGKKTQVFRPYNFSFWDHNKVRSLPPLRSLAYNTDVLVGLSAALAFPKVAARVFDPAAQKFCSEAFTCLEPHVEMFRRSRVKVSELQAAMNKTGHPQVLSLVTEIVNNIRASQDQVDGVWQVQYAGLLPIIELIDRIESELSTPLIYNFDIKLKQDQQNALLQFFSFLFNLRALVAIDYNSRARDMAFEGLRVDSITDYLPKADYVANDAILYSKILRQKSHLPKSNFKEIQSHFWTYSHNGACLVENLGPSFVEKLPSQNLEERLYDIQMHWLLGSDGGLLFRVREELFALQEGYEQIFWPEASLGIAQRMDGLELSCEVNESDLRSNNSGQGEDLRRAL